MDTEVEQGAAAGFFVAAPVVVIEWPPGSVTGSFAAVDVAQGTGGD